VPNRNSSVAGKASIPQDSCGRFCLQKVTLGCMSFDSALTLIKSGGDTSN